LPSFTLAEILLVVGLIGLLAALNGWALEVGAADGSAVDVAAAGVLLWPARGTGEPIRHRFRRE